MPDMMAQHILCQLCASTKITRQVSASDKGQTGDIDAAMQDLATRAAQLDIELSPLVFSQVKEFCLRLAEYNAHTNLVSRGDAPNLVREHIADSLTLVNPILYRNAAKRLVDVGSGAGFPGLILALAIPDLDVTLIESIGKKARFLETVLVQLHLHTRARVIAERAEVVARQGAYRESFGYATARAVGSLALVAELTLPLLQVGGYLLAQKSCKQARLEIEEARTPVTILGGDIRDLMTPNAVAASKEVAIIEIAKVRPTPVKYPRPTAQLKRPLTASKQAR